MFSPLLLRISHTVYRPPSPRCLSHSALQSAHIAHIVPGACFKLGPEGLGYYADSKAPGGGASAAAAAAASAAAAPPPPPEVVTDGTPPAPRATKVVKFASSPTPTAAAATAAASKAAGANGEKPKLHPALRGSVLATAAEAEDGQEEEEALEPVWSFRQDDSTVTLIIDNANIDPASVETHFEPQAIFLRFRVTSDDDGGVNQLYKLLLGPPPPQVIVPEKCSHSVSKRNMLVTMGKGGEAERWSRLITHDGGLAQHGAIPESDLKETALNLPVVSDGRLGRDGDGLGRAASGSDGRGSSSSGGGGGSTDPLATGGSLRNQLMFELD